MKLLGVFVIKKAQNQYHQQNHQTKEEGEVSIKYKPRDDKKHVKGGDYVDFEELE